MKLGSILKPVQNSKIGNIKVSGIADDSRSAGKNSLFFIIKRPNFDIFSVLKETERKTRVYAAGIEDKERVEKIIKNKPVIYLKGIEKYFYRAVRKFYKPESPPKVIGITGTNGKTSTGYFIYQFLKKMGANTAFLGTTGRFIGSVKYKAPHTTPGFLALNKLIKEAGQKGANYLVMEVSSHGIVQKRIKGIKFSRCIFTNLSRDHLDYHKDMCSYFEAKKDFFLHNKQALSIINKDSLYGRELLSSLGKKISYGIKNTSDYQAGGIRFSKEGMSFNLFYKNKKLPISVRLRGGYNISNILSALATAHSLGFPLSRLAELAKTLREAPGRFQKISGDIFIDYAHTPEGLKCILSSLRGIGYQKIISVFGCGGQRDKGKRKAMGRISSQLAAQTIITSDNPRGENPLAICTQISRGCRGNCFEIILDRREAIRQALRIYKKSNKKTAKKICVLIAGKGHESYQVLKGRKIKFNDAKVARGLIKECRI